MIGEIYRKLIIYHLIQFIIVGILICMPGNSQADVLGKLGGETIDHGFDRLDRTLEKFLFDINELADQLITRGKNECKLLLIQLGNEMNLASYTLTSLLGTQVKDRIGDLGDEFKPIINRLVNLEESIKDIEKLSIELVDLINLDLENLMSVIPGYKDSLSIRRIKNISLRKIESGFYKIEIVSGAFKDDTEDIKTKCKFVIDNYEVETLYLSHPYGYILKIPVEKLNSKFSRDKIELVDLDITIVRNRKKYFTWKKDSLHTKVKIALIPQYAGKITIDTKRPKYIWAALAKKEERRIKTPPDKMLIGEVGNPDLNGIPIENEMKIDRNITVKCEDKEKKRKFPNNKIVKFDSKWFKGGWYSEFSFYKEPPRPMEERYLVVPKGEGILPVGIDINQWEEEIYKINMKTMRKEVNSTFGFKLSNKEIRDFLIDNRDDADKYSLFLSADYLIKRSVPVGCCEMSEDIREFLQADRVVMVHLKGDPSIPVEWILTYQPLTYIQKEGEVESIPIERNVYFGELIQIEITKPKNTTTIITHEPLVGKKYDFPIPNSGKFLEYKYHGKVGNDSIYFYKVIFPDGTF